MTNSTYIPLTAIDCTIPALLIDRNAPLDVLHANATARACGIRRKKRGWATNANAASWRT